MPMHRRILLVYPRFGITYWGLQYSVSILGKRAIMPPLGLLTIAALTPSTYDVRVVDLNCEPLTDDNLRWADMVCFSAMMVQRDSLFEAAARCRASGKLVVFGGPFPTACPEECAPHCDVLVLNEGEITWPRFLEDLASGTLGKVYSSDDKPDVTTSPIPRFDLVDLDDYVLIPVQFSRGCPFQCEFCDIIVMFGRRPRAKTPGQFCAELQSLHDLGYRGLIFIVDDNFIGNKREVKKLLPALTAWNDAHGRPFTYATEASIDLADDAGLLRGMVAADFAWVFIGLETPSPQSLTETLKYQNLKRPLVDSVNIVQAAGLFVYGGFILGFDNDTEDIFDRQIELIGRSAIPSAVVGLLQALPGTPLYKRMQRTGRLKPDDHGQMGESMLGYTNIVTALPPRVLLAGYRRVIQTVYEPRAYFTRAFEALSRLPRPSSLRARIRFFLRLHRLNVRTSSARRRESRGALRQLVLLYAAMKLAPADYRRESVRFAWSVIRRCPERLPIALGFIVIGLHLYRFSFEHVIPDVDAMLARLDDDAATFSREAPRMVGTSVRSA